MRKRTNALRRRYQRIHNNEELRDSIKNQYTKAKTTYQAIIRKEKTNSWKQYCTATSPINPWNEVYKLTSGNVNYATKTRWLKTANMIEFYVRTTDTSRQSSR